mmetsp:Transcript_55207/g.155354  ORF Transcript_55207/g.155354 Transcript_55207/m.155354 type:complete len:1245 (-) Transcript_55207:131-3865(-)
MRAFQGKVVEVCGVHDEVTARKGAGVESIDPNGKRGRAFWNDCGECYMVQTQDGYLLNIPEDFLRECEAPTAQSLANNAEEIAWPKELAAREEFAAKVARTIRAKGYCLIQMPDWEELGLESSATLKARAGYTVPPQHFEEAYLGHNPCSKVLWLHEQGSPAEDALADADGQDTAGIDDLLADFGDLMRPVVGELLGFQLCTYRSGTMLRVPPADQAELQRLSPGPPADDDVEAGYIRRHLDFIQRRRLCFMYFADGDGSSVELWGRRDLGLQNATLTVGGGTVLVFRPDLMSYSYRASGGDDLVLQTWFLDEPQKIDVECLDVGGRGMDQVLGGPAPHPDRPDAVRITGMGMRFPASAYDITKDWLVYAGQTDTFLDIPIIRWDMAAYYTEESGQFNTAGKSVQRHAGILKDMDEWKLFDEKFFNVPEDVALMMAPYHRVILNVAMDTFHTAGCKKESLRGANISVNVAQDAGTWDPWESYCECPDTWALATSQGGQNNSAARVSASFGLTGANIWVDTACSAALVAANLCVARLLKYEDETAGIVLGGNLLCDPWSFVGLSAAGMIGRAGRCMTFDIGANGFARGEGSGGLLLEHSSSPAVMKRRFVDWCGGYVNQDGRSASLTAPNGPSQQACIRGSWRQAGLAQKDVVTTENHGTGTALGDPIECGTVRSVFRGHVGLPVTSGKTHMGHLESTAGSIGFLKIILSLNHAAVPGNCHLRRLNAHIEFDSHFAGFCTTELCDLPDEHHHGGANSYGFGGTNARADLWARRLHRVRDTDKQPLLGEAPMMRLAADRVDFMAVTCAQCGGPMCWLCGAATPEVGRRVGRHRCADVRAAESAPACCDRCYDGDYLHRHGAPGASASSSSMDRGARIHLAGTWNAWMEPTEMARVSGLDDVYEGEVVLSDIRFELFHIVVRHVDGSEMVIHPAAKRAGPRIRVAGPHKQGQGRHWLIDGIRDGAPAGTVYRVRFEWGDFWKSVTWEALADRPLVPEEDRFRHMYCIASSLTGWAPLRGGHACVDYPNPCDVDDTRSWHWSRGTLPASGTVELLFLRDYDQTQMIYPMQRHPTDESVPVAGPDEFGTGKRWLAYGTEGERLYTTIAVEEGVITVRISTATMGDLVWRSPCRSACLAYYAVGSWNSWACTEMESDEGSPDIYRCRFVMGRAGWERFKVVANQNWGMQLYPSQSDGYPGTCLVSGPDGRGHNSNWLVEGTPGQRMEVVLDLDAEDNRSMVTCVCVDDVD